jgi:hypothetical protein
VVSGYTHHEYMAKLRERNAMPFVEDCRVTLQELRDVLDRPQGLDETPRAYQDRMSRAMADLTRLVLRIHDGHT